MKPGLGLPQQNPAAAAHDPCKMTKLGPPHHCQDYTAVNSSGHGGWPSVCSYSQQRHRRLERVNTQNRRAFPMPWHTEPVAGCNERGSSMSNRSSSTAGPVTKSGGCAPPIHEDEDFWRDLNVAFQPIEKRPRCGEGQAEDGHESRCSLSAGLSWSMIMLQSFAHAHDIVHRVAEPKVNLNHSLVGSADLEIDLGATCLS